MKKKIELFMKRFSARKDVYARYRETTTPQGEKVPSYFPHCVNFYKPGCNIKEQNGGSCVGCDMKQHQPVTPKIVAKHITGVEAHMYYMVMPGGVINFGAIDFDLKPGKEDKGYYFSDVQKVVKVLTKWGIDHGIARSTNQGFHIYFFFDQPCQTRIFRAVINQAYEKAGFMEDLRQGRRLLPEVFPKQDNITASGMGNGIKPPMVEANFPRERNGWITVENEWIKDQWGYFERIKSTSPQVFENIITLEGIEVPETMGNYSSAREQNHKPSSSAGSTPRQHPLTGSVDKLLEGCRALNQLKKRALSGEVLGHDEGFALFHTCMGTTDGISWFKKNVTGWGDNERDLRQLEFSELKNYKPYTCRKMQEIGVCVPGTKCFDKKPPVKIVEGRKVVQTDLPIEKWPEPSPIRYAHSKSEDYLEKLRIELQITAQEENEPKRIEAIGKIFTRVQAFDEAQQTEFKKLARELQLIPKGLFTKVWNGAVEKSEEIFKEAARSRTDIIEAQGVMFKKLEPFGYAVIKKSRNKLVEIPLSDFDIEILEERIYQDDDAIVRVVFHGEVRAQQIRKKFQIETDKWQDMGEFMKFFGRVLGLKFTTLRSHADNLRLAAAEFSNVNKVTKQSYLMTQGWYNETFLMPSYLVNIDGIQANTRQFVDLQEKQYAKNLDFSMLSDETFKETMLHIRKDFLNAWPELWTYLGISHTLTPLILRPLGVKTKPFLFYEGLTGAGKTKLTHALQYFWGDFDSLMMLSSTGKGLMSVAHDFKDAALVMDDYKGSTPSEVKALDECIQRSYDPGAAIKLRRDSSQMTPKGSRAIFLFSGEHFLSADAAKVARGIIVEVTKQDTSKTSDAYDRVFEMCHNYKGVTPRFLHWFLNQDMEAWKNQINLNKKAFIEEVRGKQNADRICFNLGLSFTVWQMWAEFMVNCKVVERKQADLMSESHWNRMLALRTTMISRCEEEQDSTVFLRVLRDLILAGDVGIQGMGEPLLNKPYVGFVSPSVSDEGYICLYTDASLMQVKKVFPRLQGSSKSIAKQMIEDGICLPGDSGRSTRLVSHYSGGGRSRAWVVSKYKLGIDTKPLQVAPTQDNEAPVPKPQGIY